jgi:hypothetical protein
MTWRGGGVAGMGAATRKGIMVDGCGCTLVDRERKPGVQPIMSRVLRWV